MAAGKFRIRSATSVLAAGAVALLTPAAASARILAASPHPLVSRPAHGMGLIKTNPPRVSAAQSAAVHAEAVSLPVSVDLTPYAMPVGNQGQVGSCAAWATDYSALGYWENKQGIPGGGLEPMYTYSQVTGGHDVGSSIEGNLFLDEQGVDNRSDYWQGDFDYWDMPAAIEKAHGVNWKLTGYANLPIQPSASSTLTQQSIEGALAAGMPVVVGIPVYDNFFSVGTANGGYYSAPSGYFDGNHAITALGYNSNGLVIENSWGTGWGNRGYATLSWSFVNRYVFDAVSVSPMRTGQPVNTIAPSLPAAGHQGQALTVTNGSWTPSATSYAYQWQRESTDNRTWTPITGATAAAYTPGSADLGRPLRVLVTATNASGQGAATSSQTGSVTSSAPINATAPTATGALRVGQTLTATSGTWAPAATSYADQWQRSTDSGNTWTSIAGATGTSYLTSTADAGAYVRVRVTGANAYGTGVAASSAALGPFSGAPYSTAAPVITGTPARGTTLAASAGSWSPAPSSVAYQWQALPSGSSTWSNIYGATFSSYMPGPAYERASLRVVVTGTNAYGRASATSAATAPVKASPPVNTSIPTLAGSALTGHLLTATAGSWSGAGNSYAYQWQRSSGSVWSAIAGATSTVYIPSSADVGASLRVVVTATNPDGTASATTGASARLSR